MNIKFSLHILIMSLLTITIVSCDDDLSTVGGSISPELDGVQVFVDTVDLKARTIALDRIYARTTEGLVGEYTDPTFGSIKADFLCEMYGPDSMKFQEGNGKETIKIDSVRFNSIFNKYLGDSLSPMNISIYKVNKSLKRDFYTDIDPTEYYSSADIIGQESFVITKLHKYDNSDSRLISIPIKNEVGKFFLDTWKEHPEKLLNSDSLQTIFPGLFVTSDFSSGSLIKLAYSYLDVYYSYEGKTSDESSDSTYHASFSMAITPEVIQMNHIKATNNDLLANDDPSKAYIKSPVGVCTELTIPLKEINDKAEGEKTINSVKFNLVGNSELEAKTAIPTPTTLLLINKDSIDDFFLNRKLPDSKTSFLLYNSNTFSSYPYKNRYVQSSSATSIGNLASIVNHYNELKESGKDVPDELKYVLVSVTLGYTYTSSSAVISGIYHQMMPSAAILRTDYENMRMPLVFSKYNSDR